MFWKRIFPCLAICLLAFSACSKAEESLPLSPGQTAAVETAPPAASPSAAPATSQPTATQDPGLRERPVFLAWPLPALIGLARISQYPNSAWTWNYLGLNPGYECPPMFGYLLNVDSWPYWRDPAIPEAEDKAQADPHNFEMVACYSTSSGGPSGHEGTDIKAPAGTPVYAAADGLVQEWRDAGLNSMLVLKHCLSGAWDENFQCLNGQQWYTTYMHLVLNPLLLKENQAVAQGESLGTIYDQSINSHLHFEVGHEQRSYANFVNPWGGDSAPWLGCLWQDQALCIHPNPAFKRLAFYSDGEFLIARGDGTQIEIQNAQGLKKILLWGERVAVLDSQGQLFARDWKEPADSLPEVLSTWQRLAENVLDFQITDTRVAILDQNRNLLAQEGDFGGEWIPLATNVRTFSLADTRLGYLTDQGDLYVQTGALKSEWLLIKNQVLAFQLVDNRIAFVDEQRNLFVNEGDLSAEYQLMAGNTRTFQLSNARLGVVDMQGNLLVKEGNLRAEWVSQAEKVRSFQLTGMQILKQGEDGRISFKEGNLYQTWADLPDAGFSQALLNGEMPVIVP
ncbi:MAG: M23 family metallopeptidase [Anaerolineae bacterium]|nr:M23 family metallopeptidase [Anaerolineae bacterium]